MQINPIRGRAQQFEESNQRWMHSNTCIIGGGPKTDSEGVVCILSSIQYMVDGSVGVTGT